MNRPTTIDTEAKLDTLLSEPTDIVLDALRTLDSDLLILGVGGKMGPTLARMAARALAEIGSPHQVIGVARFSQPGLRKQLDAWGVQTMPCNLLDRTALATLLASRNIIFMAGQKFGTTGNPATTWAMNTLMPALVAERFSDARIVVFSTGNVYPLTPIIQGGSQESDAPEPVGEYASSCLGRERMFEHFSNTLGLRCAIMRLNYAIDLRYGVLLDIAQKVKTSQPIDVTMAAVNVIWQGDANAQALAMLPRCTAPPTVLNITGPETVSVRWLATEFGRRFDISPILVGDGGIDGLTQQRGQGAAIVWLPTRLQSAR